MKKHKLNPQRSLSTRGMRNGPLLFSLCFGLIALVIGVSQIFAQGTVAFVFLPTSQSANAGDNKSVAVTLYNNNQNVDGGSVAITYDQTFLDFVSFSGSSNSNISISNNSSSAGRYSYEFTVLNAPQANPNLGTLTLRAKPVSTTQAAYIRFDGINTKAYNGPTTTGRTYYQIGYGQAAITINPSSTPPSSPSSTQMTPPTPTATNSNTSLSVSNPKPATQATSVQQLANQGPTTNAATSDPFQPSGSNSVFVDNGSFGQYKKPARKNSLVAFFIIGGGILLVGSGAILFLKFKRASKNRQHQSNKNLPANVFDDTGTDPLEEENIVVQPDAVPLQAETVIQQPAAHEYPQIILKHTSDHHKSSPSKEPSKETAPPEAVKDLPPEVPKPKALTEETLTKVKESTDRAHHKEIEVDIVHLKPGELTPPAPVAEPSVTTSRMTHKAREVPVIPSPSPPVSQHIPSHHKIPALAPHKEPPATTAPNNIPAWQTHLTAQSASASNDDPPDMFELAAEHPETFGSYQALEAEASEKSKNKKGLK